MINSLGICSEQNGADFGSFTWYILRKLKIEIHVCIGFFFYNCICTNMSAIVGMKSLGSFMCKYKPFCFYTFLF